MQFNSGVLFRALFLALYVGKFGYLCIPEILSSLAIGHPFYDTLTAVKIGYPLTSVT